MMTALVVIALSAAPNAAREKQELRFVELLKAGLRAPPKDPAAQKAMKDELKTLMFALADIDPNNPPADAGAKLTAMQAEVLGRRDPALRDELAQQMALFACRSKQIEAKSGLKSVWRMQTDEQTEKGKFAATLKELDAEAIISPRRYAFTMVEATAKKYRVRATGKDDMAGDVWEVDERGEPANTANLCQKLEKPKP